MAVDLIPGLPDDMALECLIRFPFHHFSTVASVCTSWQLEISLPEFRRRRKASGFSRPVVVLAQARHDPSRVSGDRPKLLPALPDYHLVIYGADTGSWSELPSLPGFPDGLPLFCQLVEVGLDLVVMGGYHPVTWQVLNSVYVYNFASGKWRRGADMPGGSRSLFGCGSDSNGTVLVAGGHDQEKNALKSALSYDVAKNAWTSLFDMATERDECKVLFRGGTFHVIGGYPTDKQGLFQRSAEAFDAATCSWSRLEDDFLETATCPRTCADDGKARLYMCRDGDVVTRFDDNWQVVARLPDEVCSVSYSTTWQDNLLVIGCGKIGEPHSNYRLNLRNRRWSKVEMPEEYSGQVQSGCCLEI